MNTAVICPRQRISLSKQPGTREPAPRELTRWSWGSIDLSINGLRGVRGRGLLGCRGLLGGSITGLGSCLGGSITGLGSCFLFLHVIIDNIPFYHIEWLTNN